MGLAPTAPGVPLLKLERSSPVRSSAVDLVWLQSALMQSRYPLPQSYIDFAEAYGYGWVLGLFIMWAPTKGHPDSLLVQSDKVRGFIRTAIEGGYFEHGPAGTAELTAQLFPFAMSENGEYLAWDLQPEFGQRHEPAGISYLLHLCAHGWFALWRQGSR
jgi:hypothetical protein